jgi:AcrR family transcriptional regulator
MKLPHFDARACGSRCSERSDAAAHRAKLLKLARKLAAERGLEALTMRDLARAAGVGQGTLYRKFPHKAALAQALLGDAMVTLRDELQAALDDGVESPVDHFIEQLVGFTLDNRAALEVVRSGLPADAWVAETPLRHWQDATLTALLRAQYPSAPVSPGRVARLIGAALHPQELGHRHVVEQVPAAHIASELSGMARRLCTP